MLAVPIAVLLLASSALGQSIQQGQCNGAIPAQTNLIISMINGTWNQIERVNNDKEVGQCSSTEYVVVNTDTIQVINREVVDRTESFRNGTATRSSGDASGRFIVTYEGNIDHPYWILATDYANYALVYSCMNLNNTTREVYAWKFSRTTALSATDLTQINSVISLYPELSNASFTTVSHSTEACDINGASVLTSSYLIVAALQESAFPLSYYTTDAATASETDRLACSLRHERNLISFENLLIDSPADTNQTRYDKLVDSMVTTVANSRQSGPDEVGVITDQTSQSLIWTKLLCYKNNCVDSVKFFGSRKPTFFGCSSYNAKLNQTDSKYYCDAIRRRCCTNKSPSWQKVELIRLLKVCHLIHWVLKHCRWIPAR
ncbi:Apolipoprotein D [Eumeta japonica]|uniref:Apolipoprotein D n=1 Tax=Eumeta variegata TaxID=151549 RepID=A0A4C1YRR6_EUMVA|nr:Apolipoprotein D [Eumeta japonica]